MVGEDKVYTENANKTKQNKTKQNKTKQNKTKQKQNKTKPLQNKTKQKQNKTKHGFLAAAILLFSRYGKGTKIPSAHISHIRILLTLLTFFELPILQKNTNLSCMVSFWCDSWC